jgi:hypothetical protein
MEKVDMGRHDMGGYGWIWVWVSMCGYVCRRVWISTDMHKYVWMCLVRVDACVHASMRVCVHGCVCVREVIGTYMCMYMCMYVIWLCMYMCVYTRVYVCVYDCLCACLCVCVCIHVRVCIYSYRYTSRGGRARILHN